MDKLATHAPFEGRELRDALKKYEVEEEELSAQGCVKARQLAGLIQIPLVMCGSAVISLAGIVVSNIFVLIDTYNIVRRSGVAVALNM